MAKKKDDVIDFLKRNQEGILIGGVIGFVVAKFFISEGYILEVQGLMSAGILEGALEKVASVGQKGAELIGWKVTSFFTAVGMSVGAYFDEFGVVK